MFEKKRYFEQIALCATHYVNQSSPSCNLNDPFFSRIFGREERRLGFRRLEDPLEERSSRLRAPGFRKRSGFSASRTRQLRNNDARACKARENFRRTTLPGSILISDGDAPQFQSACQSEVVVNFEVRFTNSHVLHICTLKGFFFSFFFLSNDVRALNVFVITKYLRGELPAELLGHKLPTSFQHEILNSLVNCALVGAARAFVRMLFSHNIQRCPTQFNMPDDIYLSYGGIPLDSFV